MKMGVGVCVHVVDEWMVQKGNDGWYSKSVLIRLRATLAIYVGRCLGMLWNDMVMCSSNFAGHSHMVSYRSVWYHIISHLPIYQPPHVPFPFPLFFFPPNKLLEFPFPEKACPLATVPLLSFCFLERGG